MTDDDEQWRMDLVRSARRGVTVGIVGEIGIVYFMVRLHEWRSVPMLIMSIGALIGSRWLLSNRGQAWLKMLRGDSDDVRRET